MSKHPADVLADEIAGMVRTYPQVSEDEPGGYESRDDMTLDDAAAMLRTIPAMEAELAKLRADLEAMRKPLTDEQIVKAVAWTAQEMACSGATLRKLVRDVERAHGIT